MDRGDGDRASALMTPEFAMQSRDDVHGFLTNVERVSQVAIGDERPGGPASRAQVATSRLATCQ